MNTHPYPLNSRERSDLMTVDETADALGISRSTVWRLANGGELPRVRVGPARRLVRFRRLDVSGLITEGTEMNTTARS